MPAGAASAQHCQALKSDLETIDRAKPTGKQDVLVAEARRLFDAEAERRKTAETRASTYLAAAGVLAPILAAMAPAAPDPKKAVALPLVSLVIFVCATSYLVAGAYWAFKALRVARSSTLGSVDLVRIWEVKSPEAELARSLLKCIRLNYVETNEKVTAVKMSREFAIRALAAFALAILVRSAWTPATAALGLLFK